MTLWRNVCYVALRVLPFFLNVSCGCVKTYMVLPAADVWGRAASPFISPGAVAQLRLLTFSINESMATLGITRLSTIILVVQPGGRWVRKNRWRWEHRLRYGLARKPSTLMRVRF